MSTLSILVPAMSPQCEAGPLDMRDGGMREI